MNENQEDVKNESGDEASVTEENPSAGQNTDEEVDLKAENEKLRERVKKAEDLIVKNKQKAKEGKETPEEVETRLKNLEETQKVARDNLIAAEIAKFAVNEEHAESIRKSYEERIVQSGSSIEAIRNDIEQASLLADNLIIKSQNEELKKALRSSETRSRYASASVRQEGEKDYNSMLTPAEQRFAQSTGLSAEEVVKSRT